MTAASTLLSNLTAQGVRLWAEADRLKFDAPAGVLTDDDRAALREHKAELLTILTGPGLCPTCREPANLQDRTHDTWFCPNCRAWSDGQGGPLARIERAKPLTSDEEDARKLVSDLLAAGCGFVADGDELRLTYPGRITAWLWTRFERAGPEFRRLAREEAERQAAIKAEQRTIANWQVSSEWMT
ncbi:MAG: hypothetical protein ACREEM_13005 [Blastocatellia bacterium]